MRIDILVQDHVVVTHRSRTHSFKNTTPPNKDSEVQTFKLYLLVHKYVKRRDFVVT